MTTRRREALVATATRGATVNERQTAQAKLKTDLAVRSEEQDDVWSSQGVVTRERKGVKTYLRGTALAYFLKHTKDGQVFTARSFPMSVDFNSYEFYMVLSWLIKNDLVVKNGTKYTVPNRAFVKATWNAAVDTMKL
jgi:hypothetical protein